MQTTQQSPLDHIPPYWRDFIGNIRDVVLAPFDPDSRIFVLYLATSALIAWFVYRSARRTGAEGARSFLSYLFPKKVWGHPSAWLDLRYYFFHGLTGHFFATSVGVFATLASYSLLTGRGIVPSPGQDATLSGAWGLAATLAFVTIAIIVADFTAFLTHYLQHRIPFLWQFHKVHHSAEVMHPLSNFREHPVDNLAYSLTGGATYGIVLALVTLWFGYVPATITFLGAGLFTFLFNVTGYNLRHSHVWLRWPGRWSMIFPSPAHHQVHHSSHPDHLDKNFAFFLPVWDVLFGSYVMPEDNRDVVFGVTAKDRGHELTSCVRMYALPFRDAWRVLTRRRQAEAPTTDAKGKDHPR